MKTLGKSRVRTRVLASSLILLSSLLVSASEQPAAKPTDVPATVIAHLALPQATGNQMLLQRANSKDFLYVQQAGKQGFMIVDVSKPERPSLLKRSAESIQATSGNLEMVSPDVAIAEAPEKTAATLTSNAHPTETVRVFFLYGSGDPRALDSFPTRRPA